MFRKVRCNRNSGGRLWWLVCIAEFVDVNTRFADLKINRTDRRRLFPGHSWIFGVLLAFVLMAMTNGPTLFELRAMPGPLIIVVSISLIVILKHRFHSDSNLARPASLSGASARHRVWIAWGLVVAALLPPLAVFVLNRFRNPAEQLSALDPWVPFLSLSFVTVFGLLGALVSQGGRPALLDWLVIVLASVAIWIFGSGGTAKQEGMPLYRHFIVPIGVLMTFVALPFARYWVRVVFHRRLPEFREAFASQLQQTQLFDPQYTSNARASEVLRAYVIALVSTPFQMLLLPAALIILAPPDWMMAAAIAGLVVSWMMMAMVVFHPRLNSVLGLIDRLFAEGSSLLVSIVLVIIAAARLIQFDYVSTVLDSAARLGVIQFFLGLYAFSWLYDYFVERALIESLLGILHDSDNAPVSVPYNFRTGDKDANRQWLQVHGGSRIVVLRSTDDARTPWHFNIFRPMDVFREIAARSGTSSAARRRLPILEAGVRFYRVFPATLFLVMLIWCGGSLLSTTREASISASPTAMIADGGFQLSRAAASLEGSTQENHSPDPAPLYFIAASGGGTRAAIYTMTVLEELHRRNLLHRVVGISSVSGGSLASAYFAAFQESLQQQLPPARGVNPFAGDRAESVAWQQFQRTVTDDHIRDVLEGAFEWRLVRGKRLGTLLTESFLKRIPDSRTISSNRSLGLIYNTAVVGEADDRDARPTQTSTDHSGTRLVFTNVESFLGESAEDADRNYPGDLRFVCFHDPNVPLAKAAAASANFPPVFSNIAIDAVEQGKFRKRYWVTDGGAMDNRGLISLLCCLRTMIRDWDTSESEDGPIPPIRILVVDASGYSNSFRQTRGLGAVGGARLSLSNKLAATLLADVKRLYQDKLPLENRQPVGRDREKRKPDCTDPDMDPGLTIHDLTMPRSIRSAVGTHWMMAEGTSFTTTQWNMNADRRETVKLRQDELLQLFRQVLSPERVAVGGFRSEWHVDQLESGELFDPERELTCLQAMDAAPALVTDDGASLP